MNKSVTFVNPNDHQNARFIQKNNNPNTYGYLNHISSQQIQLFSASDKQKHRQLS
jgi:hypothetical protein